jgi:hypothetical protein
MTVREFGNGIGGRLDRFAFQGAGRRHRFVGCERLIVSVERRAIRADEFRIVAHVAEDVGMIERWQGANAHESGSADLDNGNPEIVVEMRNYSICHVLACSLPKESTITTRYRDFHRSGVKKAAM